jgi:hypothetical protein
MISKNRKKIPINPLSVVIFLIALDLYPMQKLYAQQAVTGRFGCGTGCSVEERQLSTLSRMGNGWSKVLVELTERCATNTGRGCREGYTRKMWYFAKCDGDLWGEGMASDGSDAKTQRIYYEDGNPITSNAGGAIYNKWQALCNAPH